MPEKEFEEEELVGEPNQFLEPEEHEDTHLEHKMDIDAGKQEADVYTEEGREVLTENAEIEPWEEGFAQGAEGRGHLAVCAHCGEVLSGDPEKDVEREYSGDVLVFCSDKCAESGPQKKE